MAWKEGGEAGQPFFSCGVNHHWRRWHHWRRYLSRRFAQRQHGEYNCTTAQVLETKDNNQENKDVVWQNQRGSTVMSGNLWIYIEESDRLQSMMKMKWIKWLPESRINAALLLFAGLHSERIVGGVLFWSKSNKALLLELELETKKSLHLNPRSLATHGKVRTRSSPR